ncbi:hypothetical protein HOG21_05965 [bacterium]|nr:hypothetical protein [bacterium]
MGYFSKFCINSSRNINIVNDNSHVTNNDAHSILNNTNDIKNNDVKNHCLKLVST